MNERITRHLMAETDGGEERALRHWRRTSAANEASYRRRRRVWELLGRVRRPLHPRAPDAEDLIARAGVRFLPTSSEAGVGRRFGRYGLPHCRSATIAALAAAAMMVAIGVALLRPGPEATFGAAEFITGSDETNTVRLDDGTVVRLAPGSRLQVDGSASKVRQVSFEGVGYFAVARDEKRPFIIRTDAGEAEVLGTRFELRSKDREMRVVVVEGRVALRAVGERKEVGANQLAHAGAERAPVVVDVEDVNDFLGWADGLFVFQATPLRQVVREVGAYYGVEIEIADAELGEREVTAWLREQSFETALTAVCGAVGASCTIGRDRAILRLPAEARGVDPLQSMRRWREALAVRRWADQQSATVQH